MCVGGHTLKRESRGEKKEKGKRGGAEEKGKGKGEGRARVCLLYPRLNFRSFNLYYPSAVTADGSHEPPFLVSCIAEDQTQDLMMLGKASTN